MAFIDWTDQLSVQNITIDAEHKRLVNLTNRLHEAMRKGEGSKAAGGILQELVLYTKTHFKNEESMMQKFNYSELEAHKEQHKNFVKEVESFLAKYNSGAVTISVSLINYLKNWLVEHIQGSDKKFGNSIIAVK